MAERREWPQEIRGPRQYGLFRPQKLERDKDHLKNVSRAVCSYCPLTFGVVAHHLRFGAASKERCVGRKASDKRVIPLCAEHHRDVHRVGGGWPEARFHADRYFDAEGLADRLWRERGYPKRFNSIVTDFKRDAMRKRHGIKTLIAQGLTAAEAEDQYDTGHGRLR